MLNRPSKYFQLRCLKLCIWDSPDPFVMKRRIIAMKSKWKMFTVSSEYQKRTERTSAKLERSQNVLMISPISYPPCRFFVTIRTEVTLSKISMFKSTEQLLDIIPIETIANAKIQRREYPHSRVNRYMYMIISIHPCLSKQKGMTRKRFKV